MIESKCSHCGRELNFPEGAAIKMQCVSCDSREFNFSRKVIIECRNGHRRKLAGDYDQDIVCEKCKKNPKLSKDNYVRHIWHIKRKDEDPPDDKDPEDPPDDKDDDDGSITIKPRKKKK